jgi:hypothetical protein
VLKGRLHADRILLKSILKKKEVRVLIEFIWLREEFNDWLLGTYGNGLHIDQMNDCGRK